MQDEALVSSEAPEQMDAEARPKAAEMQAPENPALLD
jgi:hypothetical protein